MKEKLLHSITPLTLAGLGLLVAGVYFFFFTRVDGYARVIGLVIAATGLVALAVKFVLLLMLKRRMSLIWTVELMLIAALFVYARENGLP